MVDEVLKWPFPIIKPEVDWNEFDQDLVEFMRLAYTEGFQPQIGPLSSLAAASSRLGRTVSLVFRGSRNGHEPFLWDSERRVWVGPKYGLPLRENACVCVRPPFRSAAYLTLGWLRGRSLESLLGDFNFVGGYPAGIELRTEFRGAI